MQPTKQIFEVHKAATRCYRGEGLWLFWSDTILFVCINSADPTQIQINLIIYKKKKNKKSANTETLSCIG